MVRKTKVNRDHGPASFFTRFSGEVSRIAGRPVTFVAAIAIVAIWAIAGPFAGYSETWQLIINTGTTIITFLMVFVIQATQNRDTAALHLKLDELIRVSAGAHNALLDIDAMDEPRLEKLRALYTKLGRAAAKDADIVKEMKAGIKGDEDVATA